MGDEEPHTPSLERNNGGIRITTWNVNGIRNPFGYQPWRDNRTYPAMFNLLEADIVVMQELKIQRKDLRDDMVLLDGWDCYFSVPKQKKGYSGVAIYTRQATCAPIRAEEGLLGVLCPPGKSQRYCELPADQSIGGYPSTKHLLDIGVDPVQLDSEGRCVVVEFPAFVLLGVYSPANTSGLRDDYRHGWTKALDARIRNLHAMGKRVILTGDLNVSRDEKDSASAEEDNRKAGITHEEYVSTPNRRIFNALIDGGEVFGAKDEGRETPVFADLCRDFHPTRKAMYTHWDTKKNTRPGNFGSRIDFILASIEMRTWISHADIQEGLMGSDHCPVYAVFKPTVDIDGSSVHMRDIMNPPGIFENGKRLRKLTVADLLPTSGKLLPEFDKRRTIKDMFTKGAVSKPPALTAQASINGNSNGSAAHKEDTTWSTSGPEVSPRNERTTSALGMDVTSPIQAAGIKRSSSILKTESPPIKRQRSVPTKEITKTNGQQTLQSFFSTQAAPAKQSDKASKTSKANDGTAETTISKIGSQSSPEQTNTTEIGEQAEGEKFIDPFASRSQWNKLFSKQAPPRCEHNEPCTSLQTKIKGPNSGRWFWICPRPVGPSGNKEIGTQWRCRTFIWASDVTKAS